MTRNKFENMKDEFWNRHNRANRAEKRLILEVLTYAREQGLKINFMPIDAIVDSPDPKNLNVFMSQEGYDFAHLVEYSEKINPPLYRRYNEDVRRYKEIHEILTKRNQTDVSE